MNRESIITIAKEIWPDVPDDAGVIRLPEEFNGTAWVIPILAHRSSSSSEIKKETITISKYTNGFAALKMGYGPETRTVVYKAVARPRG